MSNSLTNRWFSLLHRGRCGGTGQLLCALLVSVGLGACSKSGGERASKNDGVESQPPESLPAYQESVAKVQAQRAELMAEYGNARGTAERRAVIGRARGVLLAGVFEDLMPHWYGTPWDFNGVSETPGEGKIACGYFVSTILRDAGLSVERFKLAQQASQNIIRSLTDNEHMVSFHGGKFATFVSGMGALGDGLFIIGLDRHVGFIVQTGGQSFFVHSDGGANQCVVKEPLAEASVLRRSRYRIVGKVSADDALIGRWLSGEKIVTVR